MTTLTAKRRAVLAAVCDTFVPGWNEDGPAADPGLLDRAAGMIANVEDPDARFQLGMLLDTLGSGLRNLLLGSGPRAITSLPLEGRVALLRGWSESAITLKRAGFQALKRLVLVSHYAFPTCDGTHPSWRAAGYPGPLPHRPDEKDEPLPLEQVTRDTTLECDVVVVGSGAGGGVAAGILAQAGKSVVVLEKGGYSPPSRMTHVEGEAFHDMYLGHGLMMTRSGSMPILAGSGVGGGTAINYTTSFPLPEPTREEWDRLSGLKLFATRSFADSLARVQQRVGVSMAWSQPAKRDQILEAGCRQLGWHFGVIPRNVQGCPGQAECGYCGLGCRHNAKQSTAQTYLRDAVKAGARIVERADAIRVLVDGRRATGVLARVTQPDGTTVTLTVRARAVVAACGSIATPSLLHRSRIANANIGRGLRLHPATALVGYFPDRVEPWTGHIQTRYSDQFANIADGYGAKFETVPVAFALPASAFGWEDPRQHTADLERLANLSIIGVLLRDRASGQVTTGRSGVPRVDYNLSRFDAGNLRLALRGAAQVLASQGATEIMTLQQPPVRVRPDTPGWLDQFGAAMDARGYGTGRMSFITFHQMASCAMGADPRRSVVGETGESHDITGLYVADASAFVTSSGVNPMITIMAIADHVARQVKT